MKSTRRDKLARCAIAVSFLTVVMIGCSSGGAGEVRGKVTFKGAPVTEGTVTFLNPKEGGAAEGEIKSDGSYRLVGKVLAGEYLVVINPPMHIVDTDPGKSPPAPVEKPAPNIPRQYRQQGTTTLKATVKEGKNEFNFDMMP
jgi:hypothetical protein